MDFPPQTHLQLRPLLQDRGAVQGDRAPGFPLGQARLLVRQTAGEAPQHLHNIDQQVELQFILHKHFISVRNTQIFNTPPSPKLLKGNLAVVH